MKLTADQAKWLNLAILVLAAYTAFNFTWVSVYHQKPLLDAIEPFMGIMGSVLVALAVVSHFTHHPVVKA
jgi:hypothetical protein